MEYLFTLQPKQTLSKGIKSLSKLQISGMASSTTVERGYGYFNDGAVYPDIEISVGKYELEVSGSYGKYGVEIAQRDNKIEGWCNCPYDQGTCKHIIASLLHLQNHVESHVLQEADITEAVIAKAEKAKSDFEKYVRNLSSTELQQLVLRFAPEHFRKEVTIKESLSKGDIKRVDAEFSKAIIKINSLFDGELHNITDFVKDTDKALEKLRPFWQTHSNSIADELADFLENVGGAFEEGYLSGNSDDGYDEYYEDNYAAEEVAEYIGQFIASIPNENRKYALLKLLDAKKELSYDVCDAMTNCIIETIPVGDLPQFTDLVTEINFLDYTDNNETETLYNKIEPYLSETKKEEILTELSDKSWFNLTLAKHYETKADFQKAYDTLAIYLQRSESDTYFGFGSKKAVHFQMIIRLCDKNLGGKNTLHWLKKYMQTEPSVESFQAAIQHYPENRGEFETYFEQKQTTIFADILEAENRLPQVVQLFQDHKDTFKNTQKIYPFFQRHKLLFPKLATALFKEKLYFYLSNTGDHNYRKVAQILGDLQPIVSPTSFSSLVSSIKKEYYRRRNLITILGKKGF